MNLKVDCDLKNQMGHWPHFTGVNNVIFRKQSITTNRGDVYEELKKGNKPYITLEKQDRELLKSTPYILFQHPLSVYNDSENDPSLLERVALVEIVILQSKELGNNTQMHIEIKDVISLQEVINTIPPVSSTSEIPQVHHIGLFASFPHTQYQMSKVTYKNYLYLKCSMEGDITHEVFLVKDSQNLLHLVIFGENYFKDSHIYVGNKILNEHETHFITSIN